MKRKELLARLSLMIDGLQQRETALKSAGTVQSRTEEKKCADGLANQVLAGMDFPEEKFGMLSAYQRSKSPTVFSTGLDTVYDVLDVIERSSPR